MFDSVLDAYDSSVYIDNRSYIVGGVFMEMGTVASGISPDEAIFIPYETGIKYLSASSWDKMILVIFICSSIPPNGKKPPPMPPSGIPSSGIPPLGILPPYHCRFGNDYACYCHRNRREAFGTVTVTEYIVLLVLLFISASPISVTVPLNTSSSKAANVTFTGFPRAAASSHRTKRI